MLREIEIFPAESVKIFDAGLTFRLHDFKVVVLFVLPPNQNQLVELKVS